MTPEAAPDLLDGVHCARCHYALRGLTADRCPECGADIARARAGVSNLPWVNGKSGPVWSFLATAALVLARPDVLAEERLVRQSLRHARRFRRASVALAACLVVLCAVLAQWSNAKFLTRDVYTQTAITCAMCAWCAAWLWAATGVTTWLFGPRRLSDSEAERATALSYYLSAGAPLVAGAHLLVAVFAATTYDPPALLVAMVAAVVFLSWLAWLWEILRFRRHCIGVAGMLLTALALPALWLLVGLIVALWGVVLVAIGWGLML